MANVLNTDKQIAIIAALAKGSSIRAIEHMTGVHRDTIMRLGVKVGQGCTTLLDGKMRDLPCNRLEIDEIWGYIGKKEAHLKPEDNPTFGNVWTFCAIDAETKLVPAFRVDSNRSLPTTKAFMQDVASRMRNRVQLHDHPDATHAYAWTHETDDPNQPKRTVTVLKIPPAVSPLAAVRVAIMQELRDAEAAEA